MQIRTSHCKGELEVTWDSCWFDLALACFCCWKVRESPILSDFRMHIRDPLLSRSRVFTGKSIYLLSQSHTHSAADLVELSFSRSDCEATKDYSTYTVMCMQNRIEGVTNNLGPLQHSLTKATTASRTVPETRVTCITCTLKRTHKAMAPNLPCFLFWHKFASSASEKVLLVKIPQKSRNQIISVSMRELSGIQLVAYF